MVISQNMNENEMGYRGSKSEFNKKPIQNKKLNPVKEQRADGSWCINSNFKLMHLRCALMGFERNYQIRILTKQLINRFRIFSTLSIPKQSYIDP